MATPIMHAMNARRSLPDGAETTLASVREYVDAVFRDTMSHLVSIGRENPFDDLAYAARPLVSHAIDHAAGNRDNTAYDAERAARRGVRREQQTEPYGEGKAETFHFGIPHETGAGFRMNGSKAIKNSRIIWIIDVQSIPSLTA
jgi:hypothetical protein